MICTHGRTAATCEQCAYDRAVERGKIPAATPLYAPDTAERRRADTDLEIPVGDGVTVHVKAGDLIPVDLETAAGKRHTSALPKAAPKI